MLGSLVFVSIGSRRFFRLFVILDGVFVVKSLEMHVGHLQHDIGAIRHQRK